MGEILLISSDLQARARVEAAARASSLAVAFRSSTGERPGSPPTADIVVLDLDELGDDVDGWAAWARSADPQPRVIGFFAHVQEATGARARALDLEVYRRGRFWRELAAILDVG